MELLLQQHFIAFLGLGLVGGLIGLIATIFWLWMLIDAILSPRTGVEKIVWVLVVLLLHVLGALLYFFFGRGGAGTRPLA